MRKHEVCDVMHLHVTSEFKINVKGIIYAPQEKKLNPPKRQKLM